MDENKVWTLVRVFQMVSADLMLPQYAMHVGLSAEGAKPLLDAELEALYQQGLICRGQFNDGGYYYN